MWRVRVILVPIDFSARAFRGLEFAIALARKLKADLHILHVRPPNERSEVAQAKNLMLESLESVEFLRGRLADLERKYSIEFPLDHCHVLAGRAHEGICNAAGALGADLVVLGMTGESETGLKRMILGGTAEQVIRHAPCPVLIARSTRPEAKLRFRKILAPVDFSECSATGVKLAAECARKFRSDLRLFHAISSPNEILPDRRQSIVELGALNLRTARNEMRAFRRRHLPPSLRVETKLGGGEPIDLICDQVERHEIDLIVISTHGRTGFRRAIMGSVAEQVARHAKCSVIVVPSRCA